ncbi:protein bric-a-brac 1-like isoform X1 [Neocloeon triangulifer]|uniref:protein bric-a-brac 1-like isoform X1 n=1 Tax=Neocloeon triangulifer TaxID=2078957 RepID=UPI00286F45E2|nr:protein bric-a-brac 1-like isoform X1 [Neocloeon triangulifer]
MSAAQQFCLRWNNHQPNFVTVFSSLLHSQVLTDVTLAADGQQIEAHKLVLSACSTYFQALFTSYSGHQHPIVILKDVTFRDLRTMVDFMYSGEVHVTQEQLPSIIKTAEMLKVKGLAEGQDMSHVEKSQLSTESSRLSCEALGASTESHQTWSSERRSPSPSISPSTASRRKRMRKSSTGSTSGSGVTERVSDDQADVAYPHHSPRLEQQGSSQMNLSTDMSERSIREQTSTDSDIQNCSQDSGNEQMPLSMVHPGVQQQQHHGPGRGVVEEVPSPLMEPSVAHHYSTLSASAGKGSLSPKQKRGRLLIRQPRLKKETDPLSFESDPEDSNSPQPSTSQYLQVPHLRVERQASEPLPSKSLLQVPSPSFLTKQHSQPLLPSQQTKPLTPKSSILLRQATINVSIEASTSAQPPKDQVPILRVTSESSESPTRSLIRREPIKRAVSNPVQSISDSERLGHCPLLRPGPALGCNFCWNTIDQNNRILRRKTKYYCPECQTNLCIVPCFQEYHHKFDRQTTTTSLRSSTSTVQVSAASGSSPAAASSEEFVLSP